MGLLARPAMQVPVVAGSALEDTRHQMAVVTAILVLLLVQMVVVGMGIRMPLIIGRTLAVTLGVNQI